MAAKLQHVFGRTGIGPNAIDINESSHIVAYIAGSTIVVRSFLDGKEYFLSNENAKQFNCLNISPCGQYLAAGNVGNHIVTYELFDDRGVFSGAQQSVLASGPVVSIKFVPKSHLLLAVGDVTSGALSVWKWREGIQMSSNKLTSVVHATAISPDGQLFVTVGERHVKYWNIPAPEDDSVASRSAILAERRSSTFIGCVFVESNRLLAVTADGLVVEFHNKKYVNSYQWKEASPTCIATTLTSVLLGCSDGSVQRLSTTDLSHLGSLPRPLTTLADPSQYKNVDQLAMDNLASTSVQCIAACPSNGIVVSLHEDRTMYIHEQASSGWKRLCTDLPHTSSIKTIAVPPPQCNLFPSESFITGSSDGSIRFWCLPSMTTTKSVFNTGNVVSPFLRKAIYLNPDNQSSASECSSLRDESKLSIEVNCLVLSPNGHFLSAGTSNGFLHLFDMTSEEVPLIESFPAHDSEVNCVAFSSFGGGEVMACGGRDNFVHVFRSASPSYHHCFTLCDHTNSVSALAFADIPGGVMIFSASDRLILLHRFSDVHKETANIVRIKELVVPWLTTSLCSSMLGLPVIAACSDRQLRTISLEGETLPTAAVPNCAGTIINASVDGTGSFAVSTCSDKASYVTNLRSGESSVVLNGGNATCASILSDYKRVIMGSEDGNLYLYRLSNTFVNTMLEMKKEHWQHLRSTSPDSVLGSGSEFSEDQTATISLRQEEFGSEESFNLSQSVYLLPQPAVAEQKPSSSLVVQPAQVTRRSTGNLAAPDSALEEPPNDSQSDFISVRDSPIKPYTSSKSMLNISEGGLKMHPGLMVDRGPRRARSKWGPPMPDDQSMRTAGPYTMHHDIDSPHRYIPVSEQSYRMPDERMMDNSMRRNSPFSTPTRTAQISSHFNRDSGTRTSLSRKVIENKGETRSLWTADTMTPKRSTSNLQLIAQKTPPSSAWGRTENTSKSAPQNRTPRQARFKTVCSFSSEDPPKRSALKKVDENTPDLPPPSLRSRSQSPNHIALQQAAAGRERALSSLKKRTDSDMSYTAATTRMARTPSRPSLANGELRKSTEALNKIAALRLQMNKSTENLRKSTENIFSSPFSSGVHRARSITNLGAPLESAGSFNVDSPQHSLAGSRSLARSVGNVNDEEGVNRLENALASLKKASNPDLTQAGLYDDLSSPFGEKVRRRGAVQKKVERYHPRNRGARQQTSEESDSNNSDAGFLNYRRLSGQTTLRNMTADPLASRLVPSGPGRRLYEQQRSQATTTPRRSNYLTQKLNNEDLTGPDLGSDDSPRSSVNASDWPTLLDDSVESQKLAKHVQDCCEQLSAHTDRLLQARKMVDSSSLNIDQKRIIMMQINRVIELTNDKLVERPRTAGDTNGNDYVPRSHTRLKPQF